jgi:hypothetical protein
MATGWRSSRASKGLATIYDKDILIYCISQLMEKLKRNEPVGHRVRITSHDLLVFTNRGRREKTIPPSAKRLIARRNAHQDEYPDGRRGANRQLRPDRCRVNPAQA